ncbi:MAG TPA: ABC transporter permease [Planctomycetota bacterium]|nr:ABC transporter permease [Planctomycetota bacterium]
MDPLSPWTYGRRNVRKVLPALIILTFVVMLVFVILSTLGGLRESMLVYTGEFDAWTLVFPKKDTRLPRALLEEIAAHPAVERMVDSRNCFVRVRTLIGPMPFNLRAGRREENRFLLERVNARLRAGHLPEPGTNEVAIHENIMKANRWSLGREFGVDVDEEDWMLGRFKVVGILEGPVPVGVCSFEYLNSPLQYAFSAKLWEREIIVARPGRTAELNAFLRTLKDVKVYDKARAVDDVTEGFDRIILVFRFISILLIVVVSFVVGLINNIFFAQRVDEFAVLLAIGHTQRRVFRMVTGETAGLMGVSWTLGLGLGIAMYAAFCALVMEPRGIPLPLWQPGPLLISLILPVVAQAFAVVTVLGKLRRLDPVTIIERRG